MRMAMLVATLVAATVDVQAQEQPRPGGDAGPGGFESPQSLTVDEAIRIAAMHNARLRSARAMGESTAAQSASVRGRLGPSVHLDEEAQYYSEPFKVLFGPGQAFQVRDQGTNTFVASVGQPLVGLLHVTQDLAATRDLADASAADVRAGEAALREAVRAVFINYFEARAEEAIAQASQVQLDDQVKVAQAKLAAGVLTKADVLRVQVALANAKQQEIQSVSRAELAVATLVDLLGIERAPGFALVEPAALLAATDHPLPSEGDAVNAASTRRPELAASLARASSAEKHASAQTWALLPEVNLEGAYIRIDGQAFAPKDSLFVGVKATWTAWEWGASWFQKEAAARQSDAASAQLDEERHQVALDLATRLTQARTADAVMSVAQATIESAEEAYRVTSVSVRAGAATTTDLLDAQSALTQAKLNVTRAKYGQAAARVALARAMGD